MCRGWGGAGIELCDIRWGEVVWAVGSYKGSYRKIERFWRFLAKSQIWERGFLGIIIR